MEPEKHLKPVVVVIPQQKKVDQVTCKLPYVVNGVTFDLSSPTHIIRLPQKKSSKSSRVTIATGGSSHKEVERRRKLKITSAIQELASSLPYKIIGRLSHGDVLEGVIDHINKLKKENEELRCHISEESELRRSVAKLRLENLLLKELHSLMKPPPVVTVSPPSTSTSQHHTWTVTSLLATDQPKSTSTSHTSLTPHTHTSSIIQPWVHPNPPVSLGEATPVSYRPYPHDTWPLQTHTHDYTEHTSRYMSEFQSHDHQLMSRDPHVETYDTFTPPSGSVWRPYSEPTHRLAGLSDILPPTHSEHMDHPPPSSSFLVDSLLDDM